MNLISAYHVLHGALGIMTLLIAAATLTVVWRLRGVLQWKRSLKHEFRDLREALPHVDPLRQDAMRVVLERCEAIWKAGFPEIGALSDLSEYIHDIASALHPDQENPELCITIGSLVHASNNAMLRIQNIMRRPGFTRFQKLRLRHIRSAWQWYEKISRHKLVRGYIRYRKWIHHANILRLILLPDPFSWLIYLSNQLTILSLTRFFLMDVFLFAGQQALLSYDHDIQHDDILQNAAELEQDLEDLAHLTHPEPHLQSLRIHAIRNRLVGINAMLFAAPGIDDWKSGFQEALAEIAAAHFPESPAPMEEAFVRVILERCQFWLRSISETESMPVISRLHRVEIRYLYSIKAATEHPVFRQAGRFARKSWDVYKWMEWPLRFYRLFRTTTPAGMAVSMGWTLVRKGTVNYLSRMAFDVTVREMEMIYCVSRQPEIDCPPLPESGTS